MNLNLQQKRLSKYVRKLTKIDFSNFMVDAIVSMSNINIGIYSIKSL